MSQNIVFKPFVVETVLLENTNLIEASAGTGKTFSIAILVLRLLLEKKVGIQEILMVTFTKLAVAELEERIRLFVREANNYAQTGKIDNQTVKKIVDISIENNGKQETADLLRSAVLNLDETAVMTIHGFCQQTLNEFAFETSQLFNSELLNDTASVEEEEVQKFWRKHITGIRTDLLTELIDKGLGRDMIAKILRGQLSGKNYIFYNENEVYVFDEIKQNEFFQNMNDAKLRIEKAENELTKYIQTHTLELIGLCNQDKDAKASFLDLVPEPKGFIAQLIKKKDLKYVKKLFSDLLPQAFELAELKEKLEIIIQTTLNYLFSFAIQQIIPEIEKHKTKNALISFDDMISNLHRALKAEAGIEGRLTVNLRKKFKSVFIDEFQDTDREQFEIFKWAFGEQTTLFFIGDPKQSIYAWRKADIATYFEARNWVRNQYSMNVNYRSATRLVDAMNQFFLPNDDFDTFNFGLETERIDYHKVDAKKNNDFGELKFDNESCVPISIVSRGKKEDITTELCHWVLDLLTNKNFKMGPSETSIKPSDIGILVRTNKNGIEIKEALSKIGIPAVTVTNDKILQSLEAREMVYLLEAILFCNRSKINRALMTNFIGFGSTEIQNLDEEKVVQQFRIYFERWKNEGIYTVLMKLFSDFGLQQKLIGNTEKNGERILTNLYHLSEILFKTENRQHLGPADLIDWLKINIQKSDNGDDEMEQRIENDENAVNILSIHKSKGLEFKIVFAPDLDMKFKSDMDRVYSLRMGDGKYVSAKLNQLTPEEKEDLFIQEEQENRRLVYVALTRAVYKCFVFKNAGSKMNNSTLSFFTEQIQANDLIEKINDPIEIPEGLVYRAGNEKDQIPLVASDFKLREANWMRMSYSGLAAHNEYKIKDAFESSDNEYDQFIFSDLRKGAKTGNFLHYIFENLDFTKTENSNYIIGRAMKRFMPNQDVDFAANIQRLIQHVVQSKIKTETTEFQLKSVPVGKCLHELEFDFPVGLFKINELENLMNEGILIGDKYYEQAEGVMNGKIDLFFEHDGKYYILDWKSNYLGPTISDYSDQNLMNAMSESNYHLQYLIYSYAVRKYLKSRLGENFDFEKDFGGVIYLFVRGLRENQNHGVFYYKPNSKQMEEMNRIFDKVEFQD